MIKGTSQMMYGFGPITQAHIFDIQRWRNAQMNVLRQKVKLTRHDQVNWLKGLPADKRQQLFAITLSDGKKQAFIGYCGLTNIDLECQRAEVSFLVATSRAADHKIYRQDMLAALDFLADYAFKTRHLNRIFTETFAFRKEHIRILEEFGLRKEGVLRQHVFKGKFYDSLMHGMLAAEYRR